MILYNNDSFSASFESMSIETQFNDSLSEDNIIPPFGPYIQLSFNHSIFLGEPQTSTCVNIYILTLDNS